MIYIVKNFKNFKIFFQNSNNNKLYVEKKDLSYYELQKLLVGDIYNDYFFEEGDNYKDFFMYYNVKKAINIYIYLENISYISPVLMVKSDILIDNNFEEEENMFSIRKDIISILRNNKNRSLFNFLVRDLKIVFFARDYKVAKELLIMLREKYLF